MVQDKQSLNVCERQTDASDLPDSWLKQVHMEAFASQKQNGYNCVEITRMPKKIDGKSLVSLIISASRITPKRCNICLKENSIGILEQVAVVEFKSERDAVAGVDKLKSTSYGKSWHMKITSSHSLED